MGHTTAPDDSSSVIFSIASVRSCNPVLPVKHCTRLGADFVPAPKSQQPKAKYANAERRELATRKHRSDDARLLTPSPAGPDWSRPPPSPPITARASYRRSASCTNQRPPPPSPPIHRQRCVNASIGDDRRFRRSPSARSPASGAPVLCCCVSLRGGDVLVLN